MIMLLKLFWLIHEKCCISNFFLLIDDHHHPSPSPMCYQRGMVKELDVCLRRRLTNGKTVYELIIKNVKQFY